MPICIHVFPYQTSHFYTLYLYIFFLMFTDLYYTIIYPLEACNILLKYPIPLQIHVKLFSSSCTLLMDFLFSVLNVSHSCSSVKSDQPMHSQPWYNQHKIGWLHHGRTLHWTDQVQQSHSSKMWESNLTREYYLESAYWFQMCKGV